MLLLLCGLGLSRAHAATEDYGRLPSLEHVAISPGGTRLAFVRTDGDDRYLLIMELGSRKLIRTVKLRDVKLRSIRWADERHLLLTQSATALPVGLIGMTSEWSLLSDFDVTTGKQTELPELTDFPTTRIMNVMWGGPQLRVLDGHSVVFVTGVLVRHITMPALFRIDLDTGRQKLVREGSEPTTRWLVDQRGEIVAESEFTERELRWVLRARLQGHMRDVFSRTAPIERPVLLGCALVPDTLLLADFADGRRSWRPVSLQDGRVGDPLPGSERYESMISDVACVRPVGARLRSEQPSYEFFDLDLRRHWSQITTRFAGEDVTLASETADLSKLIVLVDGTQDGFGYFLIDTKAFTFDPVGKVHEDVSQVFETRRITYKAADGLDIPAYLTLPRNSQQGKLPLVALVHSGPSSRDLPGFDWWAQALAEQGYAVLRVNYRGSNLDPDFEMAGFGEWGRKMQTDVSTGVRLLIEDGTADAARICIMGAGYGGYAALAGVTLESGLYRCAVSVAGASDLRRYLDWQSEMNFYGPKSPIRYLDRYLGVTGASDPRLREISPALHAERVTAPVLLIHGKDDTVVPFAQSRIMQDALRKAGKPVELVALKAEDHWLSRSATRLQMLQASIEFLRRHNPP